jgi:hypothetical protein
MATYTNLSIDSYYLIREEEGGEITLVQPVMETNQCLLILQIDEIETTVWKKKDDTVFEIIEQLTEEQVAEYENLFEDEDEAWDIDEPDYDFDDEEEDEEEEEEGKAK